MEIRTGLGWEHRARDTDLESGSKGDGGGGERWGVGGESGEKGDI